MFDKIKKLLVKNNKAFTLIEMLVVVSIFSTVVLIATNIYVSVTFIQTRVASLQKIQEDVRFVMETVAQSIRLSSINYIFYTDNNIDLHQEATGKPYVLALIDQTGGRVFYRRSGSTLPGDGQGNLLQVCYGEDDCKLTDNDNWQDITPKGVEIKDLKFIITPSADPFTEVASQSGTCSLGETCSSAPYNFYRCNGTTCQYYSDGQKFQPKVKVIIKTESPGERLAEKASMNLQTIISTRIPHFEIKNLYYD